MNLVYALSLLLGRHVISVTGENHLRGLAGELHPVDGVYCDEQCINEDSPQTCQNKCHVYSSDELVECMTGHIPDACYDECCDGYYDGSSTKAWKTVLGVKCSEFCMEDIAECDDNCEVVDNSGSTRCIEGNLPNECEDNCCDVDDDVDNLGYGSTIHIDFDFPGWEVGLYADRIIDAIYDMIGEYPDHDNNAENDLEDALTAALVAVADEVEESLEDIQYGVNDDMEALEGRVYDLEDEIWI